MSNTAEVTTKYKPRPYFNVANQAEAEADEQFDHKKNQNVTYGRGEADSATQEGGHDATSNDTRDYKKSWIELKKHYDTEVSDLRRQLAEKEQEKSFTPPKTAEELEAFRTQHPEFYDVMMSVAHTHMNQYGEQAGSRLRQLEEKLAQTEQEKAFAQIEKAHPDYVQVVQSPEFLEWIEEQDSALQAWVKTNSSNARQFIRAIDLYKMDAGITKKLPKREESKETKRAPNASAADSVSVSAGSAVTVGGDGKRIWTREEINRMTPDQFAKHEAELDEAMMQGRVR